MSEKDWAVNEAANLVATGIECFTELDGTATTRANLNIVADTLRRAYHRGRVAGMREAVELANGFFQQGFGLNCEWWDADSDYGRGRKDAFTLAKDAADKLEAEKP